MIDFAAPGGAAHPALAGWDPPAGGLRWARGKRSGLTLPRPAADGPLVLQLTVEPMLFAPLIQRQTLRMQANGVTLRLARLTHRTVFTCRLTPELLGTRQEIDLTFEHPDAFRQDMVSGSADSRFYSVGFVSLALLEAPRATPPPGPPSASAETPPAPPPADLSDAALLGYFCSLGDNCEFGLLQRRAGIEPMDLLRFSGMRYTALLDAIDDGFAAVEDFEQVELQLYAIDARPEYITSIRPYHLETHTGIYENELPPPRVLSRELKKFRLQRRLLLADLAQAGRIFVYKWNDLDARSDISGLFTALRRRGDVTLLVVARADPAHPPGTVERLAPGLMRGYLDRFNRYDDASASSSPFWLDVCRAAYALWRAPRGVAAPLEQPAAETSA